MAKGKSGGVTITPKTIQGSDVFVGVAKEVESLPKEKAFDLVSSLMEDVEANHFRLGGILAHIQSESSKDDGEEWLNGAKSFKEVVENQFGLHYRKAMYLVGIYKALIEKQIPWESVSTVGWTKLKELAPVLTPKNVDGWVKKAKAATVIQLIEMVKSAMSKGKGSDAKDETKPAISTLTFKVHEDQKEAIREAIDKVKDETSTEFDSVGLFNLCQGYLGNSVTVNVDETEVDEVKPKGKAKKVDASSMADVMKEMGPEKVLEIFGEVFPDVDVSVSM